MVETETDIALMMEHGAAPALVRCGGSWLLKMRVSACGVAWRPSVGEFGHRSAEIWLKRRRCKP
jgi:hypothetical protein